MTRMCFVSPYRPMVCGIADYTEFITRRLPQEEWRVISFDPRKYGAPLTGDIMTSADNVWYGIPDRPSFSATIVEQGASELGLEDDEVVFWFQHEFGIWPDDCRFVSMLRGIRGPKVVTLHTLHFQSRETPAGLCRGEYEFLRQLLPHVDAITVFTRGVHRAVSSAFPEHRRKVHVLKHGVHTYPEVSHMSRREAKEKLHHYLLYETELPQNTKEKLHEQRLLLAPATVVIGQTGFLCPNKETEVLFQLRDRLQRALPPLRIAALRIGMPRDCAQESYAENLRIEVNSSDEFLFPVLLQPHMLPVVQRAFDVNLHWAKDCTQSGILAHALGAGAIVVGRQLEGVGETLKDAGAPRCHNLDGLVATLKRLILHPDLGDIIEENALRYSQDFSWDNQAQKHRLLAEDIATPAQYTTLQQSRAF